MTDQVEVPDYRLDSTGRLFGGSEFSGFSVVNSSIDSDSLMVVLEKVYPELRIHAQSRRDKVVLRFALNPIILHLLNNL